MLSIEPIIRFGDNDDWFDCNRKKDLEGLPKTDSQLKMTTSQPQKHLKRLRSY